MSYYVAPGVKIREIDLSEYSPTLSTSVCCMVGTATKGPINTATFIPSADQFIQTFGQPTSTSFLGYAALEYLKRGSALWIIRVCGGSADGGSYTTAAKSTIAVTGGESYGTVLGSNEQYFTITAATAGTHTGTETENFLIELDTNDDFSFTIDGGVAQTGSITAGTYTASTLSAALNLATTGLTFVDSGAGKIKVTLNTTGASHYFTVDNIADEMWATIGFTEATYTGTDGTDELSVTLVGTGAGTQTFTLTAGARSAAQIAATIVLTATNFVASADSLGRVKLVCSNAGPTNSITVDAASTADTPLGFDNDTHAGYSGGATTLTLYANSEGTWANSYYAIISDGTTSGFALNLYNSDDIRVETFDNLSKDSSNSNFHTTILANNSEYITSVDVAAVASLPTNGTFTLVAGNDGIADVTSSDYIGQNLGLSKTGLEILSNPADIAADIIAVPGITAESVQLKMISICEVDRQDCFAVLDTPYGITMQNAVAFMNGSYEHSASLNSSYAALYWPWIKVYDQYSSETLESNKIIWLPPSGFVCAQIAYTDYIADPWFPPAGSERGRIITASEIEYNCEEGDIEYMYGYPNNLNPIVERDSIIQIYGQKTLQRAATSKDRIATRRMLLYGKKVVRNAVSLILWEPNDEITWRRFSRLVTPIFETIKDRRGLYAYRVVCDESTNTTDLIAQNIMAGKILMQHMKYSEIIQVKFVSTPTGVNFTELDA